MSDVTFSGVTGRSQIPSLVSGLAEAPLRRIRFKDVELTHGTILRHAEDVAFEGGTFSAVSFTKEEEAEREKSRQLHKRKMWGEH